MKFRLTERLDEVGGIKKGSKEQFLSSKAGGDSRFARIRASHNESTLIYLSDVASNAPARVLIFVWRNRKSSAELRDEEARRSARSPDGNARGLS